MGEADWSFLGGSLDINTVDRGVTSGATPPPAGGSFVYAFNSLVQAGGAVGKYPNQSGFDPAAKGSSIRGAVQRGAGGGSTGFSPFLFSQLQGNSVNDSGYKLGLSDEEPHRIVLRKGSIASGCPAVSQTTGLLAQSSESFLVGDWLHLRLDAIVNLNDDVILNCYYSDLDAHDVDSPVWTAIPGIAQFIDDHLGINSGSQPYTSGRMGFAFQVTEITRRSYFDYLEAIRQV